MHGEPRPTAMRPGPDLADGAISRPGRLLPAWPPVLAVVGHPDHQAATGAALRAGRAAGLPVLAWTLPANVASQLRSETGQTFAGQPPDRIDLCIRVDRARQRRAALMHASQISPTAVLWRR